MSDKAIVPVQGKKKLVVRIVVADKSGSIGAYGNTSAVIEALNAAVRTLQTLPGYFVVSTWTFGEGKVEKVHGCVLPNNAVCLSPGNYIPSGGTPLYQALVSVFQYAEAKRMKYMGEIEENKLEYDSVGVYITFISDGDDTESPDRFEEACQWVRRAQSLDAYDIDALVVKGAVNAIEAFKNLGFEEQQIRDVSPERLKYEMNRSAIWTSGLSVSGLTLAQLIQEEEDSNTQ